MKNILNIFFVLFFISSLFSQEKASENPTQKISLGTNLGLNLHSSEFKDMPGVNSCCDQFTGGNGFGYNFNFRYEYGIYENLYLGAGFGYRINSADLSFNETRPFNFTGNDLVQGQVEHKIATELSTIGLTIGGRYHFTNELYSFLGYRYGIINQSNYTQTEELITPKEYGTFSNGSRLWTNANGTFEANNINSIEGEIGYQLPLSGKNLKIIPTLNFSLGLTNLLSDSSWKANQIMAGVRVQFDLFNNKIEEPELDNNQIPESLNISEDIAYFDESELLAEVNKKDESEIIVKPVVRKDGTQINSNKLVLEEILSTRMLPILNYIFFDHNSYDIPIRYIKFNSDSVKMFSINDMFNQNTLDIYHNILNIVGQRLKKNSDAKISIYGYRSDKNEEKNNKVLSVERAKSIQDYLNSAWGISKDRLILKSGGLPPTASKGKSEEYDEENRRVELKSDSDIFEPLIMRDTLLKTAIDRIRFYTVIDTNIKVDNWEFEIYKDGKEIFSESSSGTPPFSIDWTPTENLNKYKDREELTYRLEIVSEDDETKTVSGKILVDVISIEDKIKKKSKDRRIDNYSLILFDFDSYEISDKNEEILEFIDSNIKKNSEIEISGYSDKIGNADYNKQLSEKRTLSVSEYFPANDTKTYPYGESILLFNNNLPEGRFYSRTVQIQVTTPINLKND